MDYVKFGHTGLEVSRLCLGCMTYGDPGRGRHPWTLPEAESRPLIRKALEAGITFLDTANVYSDGTSEEIVGRAVREFSRREDVVIATKVGQPMHDGPNGKGLSRKAILDSIDASLRRLGTDYVDLYQIHRWDYTTPIEETLAALDDVVRAGKARYIGASTMHGWQFAEAVFTQRLMGAAEFVSMQDHVNLLYREAEREMLPFCADQGKAVMAWSPLARGRLARAWDEAGSGSREETDTYGRDLYAQMRDADRAVVEAVGRAASARGVPRSQIALAWLLRKPEVTVPIIGVSKPRHLDDALGALDLALSDEEAAALEAPYVPHRVAGFI